MLQKKITALIKKYPNDSDLGLAIRDLMKNYDDKKKYCDCGSKGSIIVEAFCFRCGGRKIITTKNI